jgi:hypothetical protein
MSKVDELLNYLRAELPDTEIDVMEKPDPDVVYPPLKFKLADGRRRLLGITRELWDHSEDSATLIRHMKRARWKEEITRSESNEFSTLGTTGWLPYSGWGS